MFKCRNPTRHSNALSSGGLIAAFRRNGTCRKMLDGSTVSNGISWSPDDRVMYLADSWDRSIYAFNLSPEQRAAAPLSGSLFALDVEAQGLAEPVFASESARERTPL